MKVVKVKYKILSNKYICQGSIYGKQKVLLGNFRATVKLTKGDWRVNSIDMELINEKK